MANETSIDCEVTLTDEQKVFVDAFSWWLDIVAYVVIGMIGLTLNMIAIWILLAQSMWNNIFNRIIMCLSTFDSMFIFFGLLEILRKWLMMPIQQFLFAKVVYPFRSMAMCCSIYTTVVLTLERYQAITNPIEHRSRNVNTSLGKRLINYIVPVGTFSFIYYVPKFFDLYVKKVVNCEGKNETFPISNYTVVEVGEFGCHEEYNILPTSLRMHHYYIFWYLNVSNVIVTCFVPIGILVFMNCKIATSMQAYRQRRYSRRLNSIKINDLKSFQQSKESPNDIKQTFILFSIVTLFVVCHTLRILMNISEIINLENLRMQQEKGCDGMSFLLHISMPLSEILLLCNSSANFFVFLCFDRSFQRILKEKFFALKMISADTNIQPNENIPLNTCPLQEFGKSVVKRNEIDAEETRCCDKIEETIAVDTPIRTVM